MAIDTKERILEAALELFAQNGYLGTSMNDIAARLGFTKAALYKHYASKQEILDRIVERMNRLDDERAEAYEMPEAETDGFAEAYIYNKNADLAVKTGFQHLVNRLPVDSGAFHGNVPTFGFDDPVP